MSYNNYYECEVYNVYDEFGKPKSQIPPVSLLCLSYSSIILEGTKNVINNNCGILLLFTCTLSSQA